MNKLIYTLFYLIFTLSLANAQWVQMPSGIGIDRTIFSLAVSGNHIFAGTYTNGVYLSTNNGNNWTQTVLNNQTVYSLATQGNNVFAGTNQNGIYLSTNNGTSWSNSYPFSIFLSLVALGNNIFAGSSSSGVYLSTNNGTNWTQTALTNLSILSLAVGSNNIYAGTSGSGVYFSTNNGTSWTQTALNDKSVEALVVNGNNIFAGVYHSNPALRGVYISTNNGTSWTQTTFNNLSVNTLAVFGNNIIAGAGDSGIYLSTNSGANWSNKNQGFTVIPFVQSLIISNNYIFTGTTSYSVWRRDLTEITADVKQISENIPSTFSLKQNYPNPFNPSTNIRYDIPKNGFVKLSVYTMLGKEMVTLVNEKRSTGSYEVTFNATNYPSGVYFYRLTAEGFSDTKRMILVK